jgi:hypothetical protein
MPAPADARGLALLLAESWQMGQTGRQSNCEQRNEGLSSARICCHFAHDLGGWVERENQQTTGQFKREIKRRLQTSEVRCSRAERVGGKVVLLEAQEEGGFVLGVGIPVGLIGFLSGTPHLQVSVSGREALEAKHNAARAWKG